MLELFSRGEMRRVAVLENAFDIVEVLRLNDVSSLRFSLPAQDPKNALCVTFAYVRTEGGDLYRILPKSLHKAEKSVVAYVCEHVISTLSDRLMSGLHVIGGSGYSTAKAIRYVLLHQSPMRWQLGSCALDGYFEYAFEQENLLSALRSLPMPFSAPYRWRYETNVYPWKLHLDRIDTTKPVLVIRNGLNLISLDGEEDPTDICTRLLPLGMGEGINQLTIRDVNHGSAFLESPPEVIEKYGVIERVWVDRSYEHPETLKAAAEVILSQLQEPARRFEASFVHMPEGAEKLIPGDVVRVKDDMLGLDLTAYVTKLERYPENPARSRLTISTRLHDSFNDLAELARRIRVEQTYSQGATNLYAQSLQTNASSEHGAEIHFYIPEEMRIVNKVLLKVRANRFRAYTKTTSAGGKAMATSSEGGGETLTSENGGEGTRTSSGGGSGTVTSSESTMTSTGTSFGAHQSGETTTPSPSSVSGYGGHTHEFLIEGSNHVHDMSHAHTVSIPKHDHTVTMPPHQHSIRLKKHHHEVDIPDHAHAVEPGIFLYSGCNGFSIAVNDEIKFHSDTRFAELDITEFLVRDGKIPRGRWHTVSVIPDNLAYVTIDMFVQGFIQSRGTRTV